MPSYRFLLVLAFAASTVTPILAAEAGTQSFKKNEGRASSHFELVERADPPARAARAAPAPEKGSFKLDGKMAAALGTIVLVNGASAWALVTAYKALKANANQSKLKSATPPPDSATPPRNYDAVELPNGYSPNETYKDTSTDPIQLTSTGQPTNPPLTNHDPNSRREERPRGRRSPVSKARHWQEARIFSDNVRRTSSHPDLLSRADLGEALDLFSRMLDKLD